MLECVVNVSEGRDAAALRAIADGCGASLVDVHTDADHHRSVFTLAGPGPTTRSTAARDLADAVAAHVSIAGARRRAPAVSARSTSCRSSRSAAPKTERGAGGRHGARRSGEWWAETHDVPVFLYDDADPDGTRSPAHPARTRSDSRKPDFGPAAPHPTLGATAVGARKPLRRRSTCCSSTATSRSRAGSRARSASATAGCPACARSASCSSRQGGRRCR